MLTIMSHAFIEVDTWKHASEKNLPHRMKNPETTLAEIAALAFYTYRYLSEQLRPKTSRYPAESEYM